MESRMKMIFFAFALLGQAQAAVLKSDPKLKPPLYGGSDKKFFGPPFPANYPSDMRPVPDKSVLDKLKGPDQPYPALQSKEDYDKDYVKDENSDHGDWKAQFEYDALRRKLGKAKGDVGSAGDWADKQNQEADAAQGAADKAGKDVDDAKKGVDAARAEEGASTEEKEDFSGPPSSEKLEKLKAAVAEAEKNYAKEQKEFEECKRQLEESKKILDDLKAREVEMERELASQTKLWMEKKAVSMNLKKTKEEAAHTKVAAAQERLKAAQAEKAKFDGILSEKKARHEKALQSKLKEEAEVQKAKEQLEKATLTLQKLRGYTPPAAPAKSGAITTSVFFSFALLAAHAL